VLLIRVEVSTLDVVITSQDRPIFSNLWTTLVAY